MSDLSSSSAPASGGAADSAADTKTRVLLAMLHRARNNGDRDEARRLWLLIVVAELERVRGLVRAYRHDALPGGRIPAADVDDVAHNVFVRLHNKIDTLKGRSIGELRKFMSAATEFTCLDYVRVHVREDRRRGESLNDDQQPAASRASDRALGLLAERLAADDEEAMIAREVIHPALALVDPNKRSVLVLDQEGFTVEEIMERLGISRDNVYQLRRRGLKQLSNAIRELAEENEAG